MVKLYYFRDENVGITRSLFDATFAGSAAYDEVEASRSHVSESPLDDCFLSSFGEAGTSWNSIASFSSDSPPS